MSFSTDWLYKWTAGSKIICYGGMTCLRDVLGVFVPLKLTVALNGNQCEFVLITATFNEPFLKTTEVLT